MRAVAVIPVRYASTRFPGKPLASILGRPMIAWVVAAALEADALDEVWVATDDERIAEAARESGAAVVMTSSDCRSGTDRVAEAARAIEARVYVNLQGDEPLVDAEDIDSLVRLFEREPATAMATLAYPLERAADLSDPNLVKVVCDAVGNALYFSRSPIPHYRDAAEKGRVPEGLLRPLGHIGLYAFSKRALLGFPQLPRGRLEAAEQLEQLRALEAGWKIRVLAARSTSLGVDRPEDIRRVEGALRKKWGKPREGKGKRRNGGGQHG